MQGKPRKNSGKLIPPSVNRAITMLYMAKKISVRQVNVDVPEPLADKFDELIERLGMQKKRAIAAAIHAFFEAGEEVQFQTYRDVYERFYADATPPASEPKSPEVVRAELAALEDSTAKELNATQNPGKQHEVSPPLSRPRRRSMR